jgi:hypothetical protein
MTWSTLVIGADAVSLIDGAASVETRWPLAGSSIETLTALLRQVAAQAQRSSQAARELRVLISDRWLMWLSLPWSEELTNAKAATALYQMHAEATYGCDDEIVHAAEYSAYDAPQCAVTLHRELMTSISDIASALGRRLTSVRSLTIARWEQARAGLDTTTYGFAVVEQCAIGVLLVREGALERALMVRFTVNPMEALRGSIRRVALREPQLASIERIYVTDLAQTGLSDDEHVVVLAKEQQPEGSDSHALSASTAVPGSFDFVSRGQATRGWRLAFCLSALALLGAAATYATSVANRMAGLFGELTESQAAPQVVVESSPAAREQTAKQIRAVNRAIASLNVPIDTLLQTIQPERGMRTALLGLEVGDIRMDSGVAPVKISAESRSGADMTRYVEFLSGTRAFESVYLVRHEIAESGGRPYRFVVEASWPQ